MLEIMLKDLVLPVAIGVLTYCINKTLSWITQACKEKIARDIIEEMEKQRQKDKKNKTTKK